MVAISAQTKLLFGDDSPYFIPQTFLYKQKIGITPHVCQISALSEVTGYRFVDWMNICGFDLGLILELQLVIPYERTTLIAPGRGFASKDLSLEQIGSTRYRHNQRYYYAKIGSRDAVVYPEVHPGSIVCADRFYPQNSLTPPYASEKLWLVEHPAGITCCRLRRVSDTEIVLLPNRAPLSPWPLRLSTQARVLGLVDRQLLPVQKVNFEPLRRMAEPNLSVLSSTVKSTMSFSRLLRTSRLRTGLTFREAHKTTKQIAALLQNRDFSISTSLLSDYEAMNKLPRHIAKIISLCVAYGMDPLELLEAGGIEIKDYAKRPLFVNQDFIQQNIGRVPDAASEFDKVCPRREAQRNRYIVRSVGALA